MQFNFFSSKVKEFSSNLFPKETICKGHAFDSQIGSFSKVYVFSQEMADRDAVVTDLFPSIFLGTSWSSTIFVLSAAIDSILAERWN